MSSAELVWFLLKHLPELVKLVDLIKALVQVVEKPKG